MRALMRDGTWSEIDPKCLFHDQYNTTPEFGNKRIFDRDIRRIEGDVRLGKGRCKYCGAIVNRGEEESHFAHKEAKPCEGCFWYTAHKVGEEKEKELVFEKKEVDGRTVTKTLVKKTEVYERKCSYMDNGVPACNNAMCRKYGIDWFTPENTFFLKYPNGFERKSLRALLLSSGFTECCDNILVYDKKIGSYVLGAWFQRDDLDTLDYFCMRNTRYNVRFRWEDGKFYMESGFSWVPSDDLGLPYYALNDLKKILRGISYMK